MAKAKDKSKNWMRGMMNPTRKQFSRWLRSQQGQFNPMIGTLQDQIGAMSPERDYGVRSFDEALGRVPGAEQISGAYRGAADRTTAALSGLDTGVAGRGVSAIVSALGGTSDVAGAAGAVSGIGGQGSVINQALVQGALANLSGLETQRLMGAEDTRRELTLGRGQAAASAKDRQRELARMLAQTKGQRAGATPNPFDLANMFMSFQTSQMGFEDAMRRRGSGGGSFLGKGTPKGKKKPTGTPKPEQYGFQYSGGGVSQR